MDTGNTTPAAAPAPSEAEQFAADLYRVCQPSITRAIAGIYRDVDPKDEPAGADFARHLVCKAVFLVLIVEAFNSVAGTMQGMMLMPAIKAGVQARLDALEAAEQEAKK